MLKRTLHIIILLTMASCATLSYQPTIDTYNDQNASHINQDLVDCKELAKHAAGENSLSQAAIGAGVGGLIGAAGGAAVGGFTGNPGLGAGIGASAGAFGGAGKQVYTAEETFKRAYDTCMTGRGHNVLR